MNHFSKDTFFLCYIPSVIAFDLIAVASTLPKQSPIRRGSGSRARVLPRWQLVEGRYKENLTGEECPGGDSTTVTPLGSISLPASFDELTKARYKVRNVRT